MGRFRLIKYSGSDNRIDINELPLSFALSVSLYIKRSKNTQEKNSN